ncbi:hypothetical protein [Burkholderia ambifaria]|uniref:hypothetical protein n=1 Tax=Burkholderia ambifaria TaxID=152480 RepID=UPI001FC83942|nr:hypothetical protein [Burkholderia ambifaria]
MNRAVDTAAAEQRTVRGVDDRVDVERRDVDALRVERGGTDPKHDTLPKCRRLFKRSALWRRPLCASAHGRKKSVRFVAVIRRARRAAAGR